MTKCQYAFCCQSVLKGAGKRAYSVSGISYRLKCYYDQILDIHFFTFSHTIGVSKISCQISIYHEQQNSCFLDLYFREFTAAINFTARVEIIITINVENCTNLYEPKLLLFLCELLC